MKKIKMDRNDKRYQYFDKFSQALPAHVDALAYSTHGCVCVQIGWKADSQSPSPLPDATVLIKFSQNAVKRVYVAFIARHRS